MALKPSPAFQFYPSDFLSDAKFMQMSLAAKGAYFVLMNHCWITGALPAGTKNKKISALLGCSPKTFSKLWGELAWCFEARPDGTLVDPRMEDIREKQAQFRESQRTKGLASAEARSRAGSVPVESRLGAGSIPVAIGLQPDSQPEGNSSSSSSSSDKNKNRVAGSSVQSVQRTATEQTRKEPAAARQIPDHGNGNGNPEEHAAQLAYQALTAEARAELERQTVERLKTKTLLDFGQPEDAHEHGIEPRAQNAAAKR
jgi:uncharacterized protein YdaU (DUF1376 family)